ncbi:MAG: DeoR family transcriptional regulator, partial [Paracoccus sp. (in: a-proteobacteria)]
VSRAIAGLARKCFLVTDISKLERSAPVRIISMSDLDTVFVDRPLPDALMRKCGEWQTAVVIAC